MLKLISLQDHQQPPPFILQILLFSNRESCKFGRVCQTTQHTHHRITRPIKQSVHITPRPPSKKQKSHCLFHLDSILSSENKPLLIRINLLSSIYLNMNLNCAFTLFLASVSAVAGFAPGATPRLMAANTAQLKTRVASSLLSETTDAAESDVVDAVATVEESAAEAVADEAPKEPEYDTSIYVGNISFGKNKTTTVLLNPSELLCATSSHVTFLLLSCPKTRMHRRRDQKCLLGSRRSQESHSAHRQIYRPSSWIWFRPNG